MTDRPAFTDREDRPSDTRSIEALTEDFRSRDYVVGFVHRLREPDLTKVPGIRQIRGDQAARMLTEVRG